MTGHLSVKMKRKDLEDVSDDFSDFSLSSPARKIRRLDADLPPIMEEEEPPEIPLIFQHLSPEHIVNSGQHLGAAMMESIPSTHLNEERAIVLYKPVNSPLLQSSSSSNFSVTVNPEFMSGIRNQVFWSGHAKPVTTVEDEAVDSGKDSGMTNDCLAVVPWVPSQRPVDSGTEVPVMGVAEQMETEEVEAAMMEIEEDNLQLTEVQSRETGAVGGGEALQQWQQQHCMTPLLPQNTSTPIIWYR